MNNAKKNGIFETMYFLRASRFMKVFLLLILILVTGISLPAQTVNDLLNLLIQNHTITQEEADSLRAEAAIADQPSQAKIKSYAVNAAKKIQLGGYAHFRYQVQEETGKADGFDIRRARLDLKADLTPYWSFRVQPDFAGTPKIIDISTDLRIIDPINFTFGQQAIPFSLNNIISNTRLDLADRSQVVEALSSRKGDVLGDNNGRDIGLTLYGSFLSIHNRKLVDYRVGIFNGSGMNKADLNEAKDVIGRIVMHPLKGLGIGGSLYHGHTPDSATLNNKTVAAQLGIRQRAAAEINYSWKFINIKGEYISGKDGTVKKTGYYGQVTAYVIPEKLQIAGRYDTFDRDRSEDENRSTHYTLGLNYFIHAHALLQAAYTFKQEEGAGMDNNLGSVQMQISF